VSPRHFNLLPTAIRRLVQKFNYKLACPEHFIPLASEPMASGAPVVLARDYNVVLTPQGGERGYSRRIRIPTKLDSFVLKHLDYTVERVANRVVVATPLFA